MADGRMTAMIPVILLSGCEIFLTVGGEGEPCADNGACDEGLVCNFDDCVEPLGEGDECDDSWLFERDWTEDYNEEEWLDSYDVCEGDLCCDRGQCVETDDWVLQPDTPLLWNRCPDGSSWKGCHCGGEIDEHYLEDNTWIYQWDQLCSGTSRLPSRAEFIDLLGGCDSSVTGGSYGFCNPCRDSEECARMFTFLDSGADLLMYTGTYDLSGDGYTVTRGWFVDMKTGAVSREDLDYSSLEGNVICVKAD